MLRVWSPSLPRPAGALRAPWRAPALPGRVPRGTRRAAGCPSPARAVAAPRPESAGACCSAPAFCAARIACRALLISCTGAPTHPDRWTPTRSHASANRGSICRRNCMIRRRRGWRTVTTAPCTVKRERPRIPAAPAHAPATPDCCTMPDILVVYYSRHGATAALARQVVRGIESVSGAVCAAAHRAGAGAGERGDGRGGPRRRSALRDAR